MTTIDHAGCQQTRIRGLAALTILNTMMENGHVDLQAIWDAANLLGISPQCSGYDILNPLDRMAFSRMPPELREAIPGLVISCLNGAPAYRFTTAEGAAGDTPAERMPGVPGRFRLA